MAAVWKTETELMDRLKKVQNSDTSVDIMTFACFMETTEELQEYVETKEKYQDFKID